MCIPFISKKLKADTGDVGSLLEPHMLENSICGSTDQVNQIHPFNQAVVRWLNR